MRTTHANVVVMLDDETVRAIWQEELAKLTETFWLVETPRDGRKAGIYRTIDMQGHGSDIDELVTERIDDPQYAVQVAACRLERELRVQRETAREVQRRR
jgi:hypothetical protein